MAHSPREDGELDPTATAIIEPAERTDVQFDPIDPHHLRIEVVGGPMDGLERTLAKTSLVIGRGEASDFSLTHDLTVSHEHAQLSWDGKHCWLKDLDSRNGTFVGDKRVRSRHVLRPGTLFRVGRTSLEFMPR